MPVQVFRFPHLSASNSVTEYAANYFSVGCKRLRIRDFLQPENKILPGQYPAKTRVHVYNARRPKMYPLPEAGYLRLVQIVGNPKAKPPIPAIIPVSKSTWWAGVKTGRYPAPVKLGSRITAWRVDDIKALIDNPH